jgi:GGDEF domain-containing protein
MPSSSTAGTLGWSAETLRHFLEGTGLTERGAWLDDEDVQALRTLKLAEDAGFPEDALVQLARVYADALGRVAEAEVRLFHFHIHERLKAQGLSGQALVAATTAARDRGSPMMEPALVYFHRRGLERAMQEDALLHLQDDADRFAHPGQLRAAIAFVDLASFTPLTEAMGDEAATQVLGRYGRLVREAVRRHDGRIVKQIGDAFMLLFLDLAYDEGALRQLEGARDAAQGDVAGARVAGRGGRHTMNLVGETSAQSDGGSRAWRCGRRTGHRRPRASLCTHRPASSRIGRWRWVSQNYGGNLNDVIPVR